MPTSNRLAKEFKQKMLKKVNEDIKEHAYKVARLCTLRDELVKETKDLRPKKKKK